MDRLYCIDIFYLVDLYYMTYLNINSLPEGITREYTSHTAIPPQATGYCMGAIACWMVVVPRTWESLLP